MPELAPAGGGQVQPVEVVGEVAPVVDRAAVVRRPPDLVWRPQHELLGLSAAAAAAMDMRTGSGFSPRFWTFSSDSC